MEQQFDLEAFRAKRDAANKIGNRWEATVYEIKEAYAAGERNLDGANLSRANLYGANLSRANLYGANLDGANLDGANLSRANLSRANLDGANLSRANLYGANLYGANLDGANLDGANLSRANLSRANLDGANLDGANLSRANLDGANLDGAKGIYSAYAPNLSSRGAALLGGVVIENGKIELRFWAGCKQCITAAQLLRYVKETHDNNIHAQQYKSAIKFIQSCFKADMEAGKWDYLLTWQPVTNTKGEA